MKLAVTALLSTLIGFGIGWLSFRSIEMAEYHSIVLKAGISQDELIEAYKAIPTIMANMESDSRMTTVISLTALRTLESGKIEETKQFLAGQPASYYVIYGPPDNPNKKLANDRRATLEAIERARHQSTILDAAITKSLQNIQK
ncbi:MAG: hypothetical protein WC765_07635 [Phycisphaerae bacterium]|jgi:hypothetical protein